MSNHSPKCVCALNRLSVNQFIYDVRIIQNKLSAPEYSMVAPSPAVIIPMLNKLFEMQRECNVRNFRGVPMRNELKEEIYALVKMQCSNVNGLALGNMQFMMNSGFKISKPRTAAPEAEQCFVKRLTQKENQSVELKVNYQRYAKVYEARVTGPNNFSRTVCSHTINIFIEKLPAGVTLGVMVRCINSKGAGNWSNNYLFAVTPNAQLYPNKDSN